MVPCVYGMPPSAKKRGRLLTLHEDPNKRDGALLLHANLKKSYIAQSPLALESAKEALADSLATLRVHQQLLREQEAVGDLGAEESRTLPAVASAIRRICESLRMVAEAED